MAVSAIKFDIQDKIPAKRALLSVSDKSGLEDFAAGLVAAGVELVSTGGTRQALEKADIPVTDISEVTGFPEIMDGRVKTLHPNVHGGLLGIRADENHVSAMSDHNIVGIDLLVVNLYPFRETLQSGAEEAAIIENIDIGGPAMVRAGAKNHAYVAVVSDPQDYSSVLEEVRKEGGTLFSTRRTLAAKAFAMTAAYDSAVANWFSAKTDSAFSKEFSISGQLDSVLRYGENPHQSAAFYKTGAHRYGVATAALIQGKQLSFNNINDTNAAFELAAEFKPDNGPAVAIIKHANPCGVAASSSQRDAYLKALACDPVSAFGGIIALNTLLEEETAQEIVKIFTEVIVAPDASEQAKEIIAQKPNLRLLLTGGLPDPTTKSVDVRTVAGGLLVQDRDNGIIENLDLKVVTKRAPDDREMKDLITAFKIAKHVKSNAIVYVKDGATVGVGAGQMSRVDSSRIAAQKSTDAAKAEGLDSALTVGSVVASDAFFPFADGLLEAAKAGATAIIQPGGSMRDDDVIEAADDAGLAMVFTGMRHFRH